MTAITIRTVEAAVGYTAQQAVAEYKGGYLGPADQWDASSATDAGIDGDIGDKIARHFHGDDFARACALWRDAIAELWEATTPSPQD